MNKNSTKYHWDLELLLESHNLDYWIEKLMKLQDKILEKYTPDLFKSIDKLLEFHKIERKFEILSNRIKTYVSNKQNTEQFEHKWFLIEQDLIQKSIPFAQKLSNFSYQVIKHKKHIDAYLQQDKFSHLKRYYEVLFRYRRHRLSPTLAKFELTFSPLASSYYEIFNAIIEKEFNLSEVQNSQGEALTVLTYPEYLKNMKSEDLVLRKNLYLKYVDFVDSKKEGLYKTLLYHFMSANIESKNVAFKKGYVESALYSDEINQKFLFSLYKNMKNFKELISEFRSIRKKIIMKNYGLHEYNDWDGYLELKVNKELDQYSIEDAKEIVLKALSILGKEYINSVKTIFENNWIDWLPRKGKISGAYYSGGAYKLPGKYILLNYNNYFDDVLTVAHELGHAVHELKIDEEDTYYPSPTIFTTEIPSIFNEILVNYYFLSVFKERENKLQMLYVYDHLLSTFVSTASVQLIYSEWEYIFSNKILNNQEISPEIIAQDYADLMDSYIGRKIDKDSEEHQRKSLYKILTVPHFYSGEFYLYKYAVGLLTSLLLAEKIMNKDTREITIESFNSFLKAGSSLSNLDCLKLLSISLEDKSNWKKIKEIFSSWLKEYTRLSQEIYNITKN